MADTSKQSPKRAYGPHLRERPEDWRPALTAAALDTLLERPDLHPGFWSDHEAANNSGLLAKAIQMPLEDPQWQNRTITAYA